MVVMIHLTGPSNQLIWSIKQQKLFIRTRLELYAI